jgi:hypothetical protein
MIVQSRRMGWTERVARMEELINACKIWIETLERKRLFETSCCMSNIKMDVRETEHEDLVVIHLIQWGNEHLCCIYSENCVD